MGEKVRKKEGKMREIKKQITRRKIRKKESK